MRRFCRLVVFGVLLVTLAVICVRPISAQAVPSSGKLEHTSPWLDQVQELAIDQIFSRPPDSSGYAVALIKYCEFILAKGYGPANPDDNISVTPEASLHLAAL